jgi:uncharacterized membrane protein
MAVAVRLALVVALAVGCGPDSIWGPPTESTCPPASTLTYDNFGKNFMTKYCTRCHSSELTGADRMGAPSFHDFDTIFGIRAVSNHIDETTAAGPAVTNKGMPPDSPSPTLEERTQLGEWIACGAP